ncbi:beta-ketoacyl synthase N-terminal-like domain-containing protein [Kitasatospora viridis]|uniref:Beta-ketoacyl synthase-like protein n=1 Tax=Kitasatospora viridis TaxID=281105 RepID=A0A561TS71_9ACTN|nr:beta-ketoacyl synthase N-terminal-like domain-containing protein [Kitasatospora viridis]TWF89964.1 beta-ketoacyl synthase-like protein [Kitasatospora viridis]
MSGLRTLATASWPHPQGSGELPPLPGFTASTFNPLVAAVAELCLTRHRGTDRADGPDADRTGLLLASAGGDRATALAIDTAASGQRMPPLLFFQSNPNAVLGHIASRWGLTGPVVAISPRETAAPGRIPADAVELAALLLADGDADQVLVIAAEQAGPGGGADHATAVLVTSA